MEEVQMVNTSTTRRFTHQELCGRQKNPKSILAEAFRLVSQNKIGDVDYNKYGTVDAAGFIPVSEKFVDNFLLYVVVPSYKINDKRQYSGVGTANSRIRELLRNRGLQKAKVKAIGLSPMSPKEFQSRKWIIPDDSPEKNCPSTTFYRQVYKIATADLEFDAVLGFLRAEEEYNCYGLYLKDLDVTRDYSGNFDKEEVVEHFVENKNFRMAGSDDFGHRTVLDNDMTVGKNCLTWMETVDGVSCRSKIYNKFAQSMESKSVREDVGNHMQSWVVQTDTRLASARDKCTDRGMTRAEVTFYVDETPSDSFLTMVLDRIVTHVSPKLVYATSFANQWKSLCENLHHSTIVKFPAHDLALVGLFWNQYTQKISGSFVDRFTSRERWCMAYTTLGGTLPIDVVELSMSQLPSKETEKPIEIIDISASRFYKRRKNGLDDFPYQLTRVSNIYFAKRGSEEQNKAFVEKAGLLPQPSCRPLLAHTQGQKHARVDMILLSGTPPEIPAKFQRLISAASLKTAVSAAAQEEAIFTIQAKKKEVDRIDKQCTEMKIQLEALKKLKNTYKEANTWKKLRDLDRGKYEIFACRKVSSQFSNEAYILFLKIDGKLYICYANYSVNLQLERIFTPEFIAENTISDYITFADRPVAILEVTGQSVNAQKNTVVHCNVSLCGDGSGDGSVAEKRNLEEELAENLQRKEEVKRTLLQTDRLPQDPIPRMTAQEMVPYKKAAELVELPKYSKQEVKKIGYVIYRKIERLLLELGDGKLYKAGNDLESKVEQLSDVGVKIIIGNTRIDRNTRRKYVQCEIVKPGEWTVDAEKFDKLPYISSIAGSGKSISAVHNVFFPKAGTKRKIFLVDNGHVYRAKKRKMESNLDVGSMV